MIQNDTTFTNSAPGFMMKVIANPDDLTPSDQEVLIWALKQPLFLEYTPEYKNKEHPEYNDPAWPDLVRSQCFDLPYEQGPGFFILEKLPNTEPTTLAEHYWGTTYEAEDLEMVTTNFDQYGEFTGWVMTFGYTDSMTNIWVTPIYTNGAEFYPEEM